MPRLSNKRATSTLLQTFLTFLVEENGHNSYKASSDALRWKALVVHVDIYVVKLKGQLSSLWTRNIGQLLALPRVHEESCLLSLQRGERLPKLLCLASLHGGIQQRGKLPRAWLHSCREQAFPGLDLSSLEFLLLLTHSKRLLRAKTADARPRSRRERWDEYLTEKRAVS